MKCLNCGRDVVGKYSKNKYCSQYCRIKYWNKLHPNYTKEKWKEYRKSHPYKNKVTKVCVLCGTAFEALLDNALYCSPACRSKANNKRQRERYPERFVADRERRRSRQAGLAATLTKEEWLETVRHFENSCAYCKSPGVIHRDHFLPLRLGGEYTKKNMVPSCPRCNLQKNGKHPAEWCKPEVYKRISEYLGRR